MPSEHAEQVTFVNWFRLQYPDVLIFAIPNGEKRHIATAIKLKEEGVVSGIPDLYIPEWKIWIEMKRSKGGKISKEQKSIIDYLINVVGDVVILGYGYKDAQEKLALYK